MRGHAAPASPGSRWGRTTIKTRVAIIAIGIALPSVALLSQLHPGNLSASFTRVAHDQALTMTTQLGTASRGLGPEFVDFVPLTSRGLDGIAMFDRSGRPIATAGRLGRSAKALRREALRTIRSRRSFQEFRSPGRKPGRRSSSLDPWRSGEEIEVTIVPTADGAIAAAFRVDWATTALSREARSFVISIAAVSAFVGLGILLLLGRLVTGPLARLAHEVRRLGSGDLMQPLSPQGSPELRQLAADTAHMRDELVVALRESNTDPLTGVANHRAFHERLSAEVAAALDGGWQLALIAIDLDNMKTVNDRYGHNTGDRVLRCVAEEIQAMARPADLCARVGGDEFAIICPRAGARAAARLGKRILAAISRIPPSQLVGTRAERRSLEVSVSVGVCDLPAAATSKDELIERADVALYQAKAGGGARVGTFDPEPELEPEPGGTPTEAARMSSTVRALALAVDAKDSGTRSHCETVAHYAALMAGRLGFDPEHEESVRRAGLLHDVGKIGTPDHILRKPGALSLEERATIEEHAVLGARIMHAGGLPEREARWVLHHHERVDGRGYPDGLTHDEIPLESRLLLVADAFEAMTSDRPYRAAVPVDTALAELRRHSGTQFDPDIVGLLATIVEEERELGHDPAIPPPLSTILPRLVPEPLDRWAR